jgi:hypothetical protein
MDLDAAQQKHWYYKLKREYEEEARIKKKLEAQKSRKEFRKMMKQSNISETLKDLDDYSSFYDKPS